MTETVVPMSRPLISSDEVRAAAASLLCSTLGAACQTPQALSDMTASLRYGAGSFEIARSLSNKSWEIDDAVMEALLNAGSYLHEAHDAVTSAWVRARHIKPHRQADDTVDFRLHGHYLSGQIVRIDEQHAKYAVHCPAGCAALGISPAVDSSRCIMVPFEDVHDLFPSHDTFALESY